MLIAAQARSDAFNFMPRHGHIKQRHIGVVQPHDHERALRIGRLTADSYVAELAQKLADSVPKHGMIVHHQQAFAGRAGRR
jgi:hypothetical protein